MVIHKISIGLAGSLCAAGLLLLVPVGLNRFEQQQALAVAPHTTVQAAPVLAADAIKGAPRHIAVPSVGVNTDVADGSYDAKTGQWTLSDNAAFFATITSPANTERGNTFIYGHATSGVFGRLFSLKNGAAAVITTDNGYEFTYSYRSREAVKPTDTIVLEPSAKPTLTLQTCAGLWNETREMFYFDLASYRKL